MSNPIGHNPAVTPASTQQAAPAPAKAMPGAAAAPLKTSLRAKRQAAGLVPSFEPTQQSKEAIIKSFGIGEAQNAAARLSDEARKIVAGFNAIKMTFPEKGASGPDVLKDVRSKTQQTLSEHLTHAEPGDLVQSFAYLTKIHLPTDVSNAKVGGPQGIQQALMRLSSAKDASDYETQLDAMKILKMGF